MPALSPVPQKTLVAFATAWGPRLGGINAFNADLLPALAAAHWQQLRTVCVVPIASADEVEAAHKQQITLVGLQLAENARG
jgi:hypothetical protein